jgi:OOP family OmpA-OmpF porin
VEDGAMKKQTILSALFMCAMIGTASAHEQDHKKDHDVGGSYLGAGFADLSVDDENFGYEASDDGFKVFGGYAFNDYFATELTYIGGATLIDATLFPVEIVDLRALSATFVVRAPVVANISMFGKVGMARYEADFVWTDDFGRILEADRFRDNELTYGFGLAVNFGRKFEIRGEYEAIEDAFETLSLSGLIRF